LGYSPLHPFKPSEWQEGVAPLSKEPIPSSEEKLIYVVDLSRETAQDAAGDLVLRAALRRSCFR
jgi:hypothetical protein